MTRWKIPAAFLFALCWCSAQSRQPDDSWLMRNYRFTAPPAPGSVPQVPPAVAQLQEAQNTVLSIMRKADFWGDFEGALFAASQAVANAQLLAAATAQARPPEPDLAKYFLAFQDGSVETATAVWTDRTMAHYLTPKGAHVQVRLDLVDWKRSEELNRRGEPCRSGN